MNLFLFRFSHTSDEDYSSFVPLCVSFTFQCRATQVPSDSPWKHKRHKLHVTKTFKMLLNTWARIEFDWWNQRKPNRREIQIEFIANDGVGDKKFKTSKDMQIRLLAILKELDWILRESWMTNCVLRTGLSQSAACDRIQPCSLPNSSFIHEPAEVLQKLLEKRGREGNNNTIVCLLIPSTAQNATN